MLNGKYDIVIYENSIRKLSGNKELEDIHKGKILELLFEELEKQNIRYDIGS